MLKQFVTIAALALTSFGVLAVDYSAYEGKNAIQEGDGGEKKTVDGIDFWSDGAPPRKFKLLGYLSDKRMKSGLVGIIRMSALDSSIAKAAKKVGGDAVILVGTEAEITGYVGNAQTTASASTSRSGTKTRTSVNSNTNMHTAAVQQQVSRYAVIQYVKDEPPLVEQ